ncbi:hypothetical protein Dda_7677 [Drechslerella dactyloides]|uniref:Peptidase A2 domain-containing protein n=1 Tax=Drechslerella dactyloides TaxID=74499 RepID=A0AAD6NIJ0_DREDA|nr:hypothetical protein Dda_7677 [Drechslerella dactyloides]
MSRDHNQDGTKTGTQDAAAPDEKLTAEVPAEEKPTEEKPVQEIELNLSRVLESLAWCVDKSAMLRVSESTTIGQALAQIATQYGGNERSISFRSLKPRSEKSRNRLRQLALQEVEAHRISQQARESRRDDYQPVGLPVVINSSKNLGSSKVTNPRYKEYLRKLAREYVEGPRYDPYVILPAHSMHRTLPFLRNCPMILSGIDADSGTEHKMWAEVLFDTGAHRTFISEDFLPTRFLSFLQEHPVNEPYRTRDAGKQIVIVQCDLKLRFTNGEFEMVGLATVLPRSAIPNQWNGVILGQSTFIK